MADVALLDLPATFYVRHGDLPLGVLLSVLTVAMVMYKKKKGQKRSSRPALPSPI
jgi:hypothetical protein